MTPTPLHPEEELPPGRWWACAEPERPYDGRIMYDERCRRCCIHAAADLAAVGPRLMVRYGQVEEGQQRFMSLAEVARGASPPH